MQYKIGDEVVLRPETKPYTFTKLPCGYIEREEELPEKITYIVDYIHSDGDIYIISNCWSGHIRPHHLKYAKENTAFEDYHEKLYQNYSDSFNALESNVKAELEKLKDKNISTLSVDLDLNDLIKDIDLVELRLSIFNGDTSRTLEEMQAIEEWLLGESR